MGRSTILFEVYKCAALTAIAVVLVADYLRTPVPFTVKNVQDNRVDPSEIPMVRIHGGHVSAR